MLLKETRDIERLYDLYPYSNNFIFNKSLRMPYIYKIFFISYY
jgi:hypothetical protein